MAGVSSCFVHDLRRKCIKLFMVEYGVSCGLYLTFFKIEVELQGYAGDSDHKESACNAGDQVQSPDWEDPLEKVMATHSSIFVWRIIWTEEPDGLQSMSK